MSNCITCKELTFKECSASITIDAGLAFSTAYYVFIEDANGHLYTQFITTSGAGAITVDLSVIDRTFLASSGKFELSVSTSPTEQTFETMTIDAIDHICIVLSFKPFN